MKLEDTLRLMTDKLEQWLKTAISMLPNFVVAICIVLLFAVLAKLVKTSIGKILYRVSARPAVNRLATSVAGIVVMAGGVLIALNVLHLERAVLSLLAGAGLFGLALGFAFQDIAANFMSGVILLVQRPFEVGDIIEAKGYTGKVDSIALRTTGIMTWNGQIVLIPNQDVAHNPLTNYSRTGKRRVDIPLGVSYGEDLAKVEKVAIEAVEALDERDKSIDVQFFYKGFGDSSIDFDLRFWIIYPEQHSMLEARHRTIKLIKAAFDAHGISIPFPIRTLDFGIKGGKSLADMNKSFESKGDN